MTEQANAVRSEPARVATAVTMTAILTSSKGARANDRLVSALIIAPRTLTR